VRSLEANEAWDVFQEGGDERAPERRGGMDGDRERGRGRPPAGEGVRSDLAVGEVVVGGGGWWTKWKTQWKASVVPG
jgi:hypothetical protein